MSVTRRSDASVTVVCYGMSLTVMHLSDMSWYVSDCNDISVLLGGVMRLSQWFVMFCF